MNEDTKTENSKLPKINFFLIISLTFALMIIASEQNQKLDYLIEYYSSSFTVDFSAKEVQKIDDVFYLVQGSQEEHLTGIKFKGRIINTQSVDRVDLHFLLSVNGHEKEFNINRISSGNSTGFNVYIPDINIQNSRYAKIEHLSSKVSYLTK